MFAYRLLLHAGSLDNRDSVILYPVSVRIVQEVTDIHVCSVVRFSYCDPLG
jgi:hypothetical protein